jgi:hypothetical protein
MNDPKLAFAAQALLSAAVMIGSAWIILHSGPAWPHDWFPPNCCSGHDCKVIAPDKVQTTRQGFVIPGNPEIVPYSSPKIRQTPPEGDGNFALCTKGGKPEGEVICLYIPTWGS